MRKNQIFDIYIYIYACKQFFKRYASKTSEFSFQVRSLKFSSLNRGRLEALLTEYKTSGTILDLKEANTRESLAFYPR